MLGAAVQAGFSFQSPSISADSDILEISQPIWQPRAHSSWSSSVIAIKFNKCDHPGPKSLMVSVQNTKLLEEVLNDHQIGDQGPVVQSVVSLTSSLRVISLTVLTDSIYSILIFFAEKMWVAFALQKLLTFFQQKISAYLHITQFKF